VHGYHSQRESARPLLPPSLRPPVHPPAILASLPPRLSHPTALSSSQQPNIWSALALRTELMLTGDAPAACLCCAVLCYAVLCYAVLCCAVLCCAVPCRAVPCCAVLCCAATQRCWRSGDLQLPERCAGTRTVCTLTTSCALLLLRQGAKAIQGEAGEGLPDRCGRQQNTAAEVRRRRILFCFLSFFACPEPVSENDRVFLFNEI
jgi:hypothetical protein